LATKICFHPAKNEPYEAMVWMVVKNLDLLILVHYYGISDDAIDAI